MLHVQEIKNKDVWESFLKVYKGFFPLFQTWQWGQVQEGLGFRVSHLGLFDKKLLCGVALVVNIEAKRGHYLHVRQGPILQPLTKENWQFFLKEIIAYGKEKHVDFVRVSPLYPKGDTIIAFPALTIPSPIHNMDAEICWVLDITKSEEELLREMRKSHRYLIKKAQALPISITSSTNKKDLEKFLPLYKQLAQKKHFVAHKGVAEELEIFGKDSLSELFLAHYEGKVICGALIDFIGDMAIYRHSASDEHYRHIPAMYVLQWEVIKAAQKRGKKVYNFWGIASNEQKNHPWYGLTLFKTGFGGEKKEFLHARDIILSPTYIKTFLIDYFTKIKKGY